MAVPLEKFVQQLENSGILAGDTLKDFLPPKSEPKDAEALARELVRNKKLTKFQVEEISKGKGKSLVLGNYVLMEKIGAGGMGQVFKAEHRRMKRMVAIKLLPPAMTKDNAAIARFEREVEAAAKLRHANIVAADDADCANGVHFLVMELVPGKDLSALVKQYGPFSVENAINYVLQAARGLEFAHKKGVVHRDIKPANLLLSDEGVVKILDMGLARLGADGEGAPESDLTSTGAIMGTVDYMSPEQAVDTKSADARADIYALGCSLHFLLLGKATYDGDSLIKKLLAHREQPPPSLCAARADVPASLETIFKRMVAKKLEDRYQTMTEVIADLERVEANSPATVVLPSSNSGQTRLSETFGNSGFSFLNDQKSPTIQQANTRPKSQATRANASVVGSPPWKNRKVQLGVAGLAVVILLAGVIFSLKTRDGQLIVTVNEADAEIQVLSDEGKVEITRKGDLGPITISVDPGKHRLKVQKDGFEIYTGEFEIESGAKRSITAKLVPAKEKPAVAAAGKGWQGWPADAPAPAIAPFDALQAKKHQEAWAAYLKVPVEYTNSIGMKFVLIPPGEFTMGSTAEEIAAALKAAGEDKHWQECVKSEAPQHKVILTQPIYLGVNEVTQAEYEKVMGVNPSHFAPMGTEKEAVAGLETAGHPVEAVNWNDAAEFCAKLSQQEKLKPFYFRAGETITPLDGNGYRLPSEAEWEYACRAGTTTKYWVGDKNEDLMRAGWFGGNSGGRTHAAGELKANPFGVSDIHGNVWEWVQDGWDATFYGQFSENPAINPNSPFSAGSERVIRGGCWHNSASYCRSPNRYASVPTARYQYTGFRLSVVVGAVKAAMAERIPPVKSSNTSQAGWNGWPADAPKPPIAPFDAAQATKHQDEWAAYLKVPVEFTNTIGMKLRLIPPGEFLMGSPAGEERRRDDETQVSVTLTRAFQLSRTEVTQGQWRAVMGTEPWKGQFDVQEGDDYAATYVSWDEAVSFCEKLSAKEGKGYRLPTEAEWEWACRSGSRTAYSFGGSEGDLGRYAWFRGNTHDIGEKYAHQVGQKLPNGFGLSDMHGNVWEWCGDWHGEKLVGGSNPVGASSGSIRSHRGGSWYDTAGPCRSAYRSWFDPSFRHGNLGFRLALSPSGN